PVAGEPGLAALRRVEPGVVPAQGPAGGAPAALGAADEIAGHGHGSSLAGRERRRRRSLRGGRRAATGGRRPTSLAARPDGGMRGVRWKYDTQRCHPRTSRRPAVSSRRPTGAGPRSRRCPLALANRTATYGRNTAPTTKNQRAGPG